MKLFGIEIKRSSEQLQQSPNIQAIAPESFDDGAVVVASAGVYGTYVDLEGSARSEADLVNKYREMAQHPEVDMAIDDIVNEVIVSEPEVKTVQINLDDINITPNLKKLITAEFENIKDMLGFEQQSYDLFRRWYVDGRLYYQIVIDTDNIQQGIQEIRYLDPRKIRKIREVRKGKDPSTSVILTKTAAEYYIYNDKGFNNQKSGVASALDTQNVNGVRIAKDSIVHVTSGMMDVNNTMVLSYLHKAIKPLNQLRTLEDATVIYRVSRAPERRIFYVDVGNLPKMKAEQYLSDIMTKFKNRIVYDSSTGEIRDDRKFMTMLEDFWFPRREGSRGTEVTTLPAGQNLGEMSDVNYFLDKLYKSLNVPSSRIQSQDNPFDIGKSTQISRDEIKFAKFINRLRLKFSQLFLKCLERQVILKGIATPTDWDAISTNIRFDYAKDNYFAELKESEVLNNRLATLNGMSPYVGTYYSHKWVRKNILRQSDDDIEEIETDLSQELQDPRYVTKSDMNTAAQVINQQNQQNQGQ
jgi:hypothetical protein